VLHGHQRLSGRAHHRTTRTSSRHLSHTAVLLCQVGRRATAAEIAFPLLFSLIVYWMMGLQNNGVKWVHFTLIVELSSISAVSLGLAISAWSKQSLFACIMAPFLLEIFRLFGGFYAIGASINGSIDWINVRPSYLTLTRAHTLLHSFTAWL